MPQTQPTAVALGYFDGVHLGHRRILRAAADWAAHNAARPVAFTFQFSDRRTKAPDILTLSERRRRILAQGVADIDCEAFDAIAALSPQQFVQRLLCDKLGARAVFCGENFRFGAGAAGDVPLLRQLCAAQGVRVFSFPLEEQAGAPISATRIRALLAQGKLAEANALLGEPYAVDLPVRHGQQLGGSLGYPTVNQIYPAVMQQPAEGVYRTAALVNGVWLPSATGLGRRPTVDGDGVTCETFFCRWHGDAYGSHPRICFLEYLWPVQKYDSLQGLQDCISRAAKRSCEAFDSMPPLPL